MFCLNEVTREYYTYQNKEKLLKILQFDSIGQVYFDPNFNIVCYEIDRKRCYRLSDFIYLISKYAIRIYFGQLLRLLQKLVQKVIELQNHEIQHNHLDMNRIWLQFLDTSELPSNTNKIFHYDIHFTGYQCPFYEQGQDQNVYGMNIKIGAIILDIIDLIGGCFEESNKISKGAIYNLFKTIVKLCQQQNLQQIDNQINNIYIELKYNIQTQNTIYDKKYTHDSLKQFQLDYIKYFKSKSKEQSQQFSQQICECTLFNVIDHFIHQKSGISYYDPRKNYNEIKVVNAQYFENFHNNLQKSQENQIEQEFEKQIQKFDTSFKFNLKSNKEILINEISQSLMDVFLSNYFKNTIWFYQGKISSTEFNNQQFPNMKLDGQIKIMDLEKIISKLVEERLNLEIQLKLIELIASLI